VLAEEALRQHGLFYGILSSAMEFTQSVNFQVTSAEVDTGLVNKRFEEIRKFFELLIEEKIRV